MSLKSMEYLGIIKENDWKDVKITTSYKNIDIIESRLIYLFKEFEEKLNKEALLCGDERAFFFTGISVKKIRTYFKGKEVEEDSRLFQISFSLHNIENARDQGYME